MSAEPMYTAQQITIPPALPLLIKQFTKAAIKTQPSDLLQWATEYFEALAAGHAPPASGRLSSSATGSAAVAPSAVAATSAAAAPTAHGADGSQAEVTLARLRALSAELQGGPAEVPRDVLLGLCARLGFPEQAVRDALGVGEFGDAVPWIKFMALEAAELRPGFLDTLGVLVEALAEDGTDGMPVAAFEEAYAFLAGLDDEEPPHVVDAVLAGLADNSTVTLDDIIAARSAATADTEPVEPTEDLSIEGRHIDDDVRRLALLAARKKGKGKKNGAACSNRWEGRKV